MSKPKLIFATTNAGKVRELRELVGDVLEIAPAPKVLEVDESASSFEGNAWLKAEAYAAAFKLPALADDSGLCVEALGGRPGVQSARYGDDDASRNARLLFEMVGIPEAKRGAKFVCALCLAVPGGKTTLAVGECLGRIAEQPRGFAGFGYDPIFFVPSLSKALAELTVAQKSAISHRGEAFRKMMPHLLALAGAGR